MRARSPPSTLRSPTGVSTTPMPARRSARRSPRFDITVTAIASLRSSPRSCRSSAAIDHDLVAVDQRRRARRPRAPGRRRRRTRARASAPCVDDRRAAGPPGAVEPHAGVDVAAVGRRVQHVDVGAERRGTARGPSSDAAPLAQSSTTRRPSRRAALERGRRGARRTRRASSALGARPTRRPRGRRSRVGSSERARARPRSRPRRRRRACGRPAPKSLMPLSVHGLWLAEIIAAGRRARARGTRRRASAARRASRTSRAFARRARGEVGLDARARPRVSRPTTNGCSAPSTRAAARPSATTSSDGEIGVRVAADAVGAEAQHGTAGASRALPLRVLRRLAGLLEAVLAPLLLARVTREQAGLLQRRPRSRGRARRAHGRCRAGARRPGRSRRRRRASRRRRRPLRSA